MKDECQAFQKTLFGGSADACSRGGKASAALCVADFVALTSGANAWVWMDYVSIPQTSVTRMPSGESAVMKSALSPHSAYASTWGEIGGENKCKVERRLERGVEARSCKPARRAAHRAGRRGRAAGR